MAVNSWIARPDPSVRICEPSRLAGVSVREFVPSQPKQGIILYLHGGGHISGSTWVYREHIARLASWTGHRVMATDHSLAPEHPFPAALNEVFAVYRSLTEGDEPVVIAGDSAGGNLCLSLMLRLKSEGIELPRAAALISPLTDMTFSGESIKSRAAVDPLIRVSHLHPMAEGYFAGQSAADPYVSPLFGELEGLPPLLVHVGDLEVLLNDSTRLADRAEAAGVPIELKVWPEMIHDFHLYAGLLGVPRQAMRELCAFLASHLE